MPNLFTVSGYKVYFWSNENDEPIHIHVSKGKPSPNATKIWLTKSGGCILASNGSNISPKELNELMEFVSAQFFLICAEWKKFFVTDNIKFFFGHLILYYTTFCDLRRIFFPERKQLIPIMLVLLAPRLNLRGNALRDVIAQGVEAVEDFGDALLLCEWRKRDFRI